MGSRLWGSHCSQWPRTCNLRAWIPARLDIVRDVTDGACCERSADEEEENRDELLDVHVLEGSLFFFLSLLFRARRLLREEREGVVLLLVSNT